MEQVTAQLILSRLDEIGRKVDANTESTQQVVTANAVLTERVDNTIEKIDRHLDLDDETHKGFRKDIGSLNTWKTELKTKIATYAAITAFVWGIVFAVGKEALAAIFRGHG